MLGHVGYDVTWAELGPALSSSIGAVDGWISKRPRLVPPPLLVQPLQTGGLYTCMFVYTHIYIYIYIYIYIVVLCPLLLILLLLLLLLW